MWVYQSNEVEPVAETGIPLPQLPTAVEPVESLPAAAVQMEEPEAKKLQEKIGLSDEEVMQIIRCGRGQGLLCAGKNRIAVEIRSTQTQYDLITTDRAALAKREKQA